jgi:hypothetical protein
MGQNPDDIKGRLETADWRARVEMKLDWLVDDSNQRNEKVEDLESRVRCVEDDVARHAERIGIITAIQTTISTALSSIVAGLVAFLSSN